MAEPLYMLSQITVLLFVGLVMGIIAKKLKLPSMLLLILTGALLSNLTFNGQPAFDLSSDFLINASILALVLIVFEGSSNFSIKDLDTYSESAFKIAILVLTLNLLFFSIATYYLFSIPSMILSLLFAAVMSGTDPGGVLSLFQAKSNKITEILKFESVINTPFIVLIPFILLDLMQFETAIFTNFLGQFFSFLQQIITGVGTGVVIAMISVRYMRRFYSEKLSPLILLTSALLAYLLSEQLGGNGVLAVTVLGVFFGNLTVKKKPELKEFSNTLSNILEMLVFILIGFLIPVKLELHFILKSLLLFVIMIFIRFIAIQLVYMHNHVNIKERIFMALNCTKGIAVAVVAFILSNYILNIPIIENGMTTVKAIPLIGISGATTIIDLMIFFIVYSIILSSITARFSQHFIRLKVEEQ